MAERIPIHKAGNREICAVFLIAITGAILLPVVLLLVLNWIAPSAFNLKFTGLLAAVGFCSGLSFSDDNYTKLRLIGTIIGAVSGALSIVLIQDDGQTSVILKVLYTSVSGLSGALLGYFMVGYPFSPFRFGW